MNYYYYLYISRNNNKQMINQKLKKWDILLWDYLTIKIHLYKHSFRKVFDFFSLFLHLYQVVPDCRYQRQIQLFLQEHCHFLKISSRKDLIEYMSRLRNHINDSFPKLNYNLQSKQTKHLATQEENHGPPLPGTLCVNFHQFYHPLDTTVSCQCGE